VSGCRSQWSAALALVGLLVLGSCARRPSTQVAVSATTPVPLEKITRVEVQVPRRPALPTVVGRMQRHRVGEKETLLDIARDAGLGFQELKDANPGVDEWIPPAGHEVLVPTRWILPTSHYKGLVVNIPEMRLYMFPQQSKPGATVEVRTWAVGIGTDEAPSPLGSFSIVSKERNPTWFVPDSIYRTMDVPRRVVPPGPDNPMGAYRIRLSKGAYAIHGTNNAWSIGRQTTHGCIRLYPEDIGELYQRLRPNMKGEILYQPVKFGEQDGTVYVEVHEDVYGRIKNLEHEAMRQMRLAKLGSRVDLGRLREAVRLRSGVPVDVTRGA